MAPVDEYVDRSALGSAFIDLTENDVYVTRLDQQERYVV